jgi:hypothetical protein
MQQLHNLLKILDEDIFTDEQQIYYLVIDRLDESWIDDTTRYKLIRALIEAIKTFRNVQNVKIVIALRSDLLERVYDKTRDSGFQAEKYEALMVRLSWTREQLKELIDLRISHLLKNQYTIENLHFIDIFPHNVRGSLTFDYIIQRTLMRPRDVISFVNECLEKVLQGKVEITSKIVQSAEATYSRKRFDALRDEWSVDHCLLPLYCTMRKKKSPSFRRRDIRAEELDELVLALAGDPDHEKDYLGRIAAKAIEATFDREAFFAEWVRTLYKIGVLGVKVDSYLATQWSFVDLPTLPPGVALTDATLYVHPMVHKALGVTESSVDID